MKISDEKKKHFYQITTLFVLTIAFISYLLSQNLVAQAQTIDPLPSWNQGIAKTSIIEFVNRVTTEDSPNFVPLEDRIAVFDNDGTLWPEEPFIQMMFVKERLKLMVKTVPSLQDTQPFKAALEDDNDYFDTHNKETNMIVFAAAFANMPEKEYQTEVKAFFAKANHPTLNLLYTEVAYQPMVELMEYLRNNDFQTWICSAGALDFIRAISLEMYGIPPQQVIGSSTIKELTEKDGKLVLWRKDELNLYNDQLAKPVSIDLFIGKRPIFVAGNVRSEGDIGMLTYSQIQDNPSFQLLIDHDDEQREFAYSEPGDVSLNAARKNNWQVVSMKNDWKLIFNSK
ncbi:MAG: HAD family hydrolase [Oscillatoria sp. PMC 1051.18]|nr:HAD family hydrolase [Oscillatoria sp. PMC 1050.18]MEC5029230.1 HAD family hydrolase [Oscillatoria sp. PMC 1051.18]